MLEQAEAAQPVLVGQVRLVERTAPPAGVAEVVAQTGAVLLLAVMPPLVVALVGRDRAAPEVVLALRHQALRALVQLAAAAAAARSLPTKERRRAATLP